MQIDFKILSALLLGSLTVCSMTRAADTGDVPLAKIGNIILTQKQMQDELGMSLYEAQNQVYQIEKSWVDQKAKQLLFDQAAQKAGLTRTEWENREINSHVTMPSDDEIRPLMQQYGPKGADANDPNKVNQFHQQVVGQLMSQKRMQIENRLVEDLEKNVPVEFVLAKPVAPHIDVTYSKDDPVLGPRHAPVTLIEFSDFQCPYCKRSQETLKQLESAYKGKIKLVMREYPLPFHDRARPAAEAALCVQEQNPAKFWPYHDKLFASQTLTDDEFKKFAKDEGLNEEKWEQCVLAKKYDARIEKDIADGQRFGVRGTPAFFINGFPVSGAQPFQVFDDAVKDALHKRS
jgi:protein-disulfide isomerase